MRIHHWGDTWIFYIYAVFGRGTVRCCPANAREHLTQVPFNRISRAITQHGVTRPLEQRTAVCKRPPLQLAQLSPAIDSQYWQSPRSDGR